MDQQTILIATAALAVVAIGGLAFFLFGDSAANARRSRRVAQVSGKASGQVQTRRQSQVDRKVAERLKELEDRVKNGGAKAGLKHRLEQAGSTSTPTEFMMRFYILGALILGAGLFKEYPPLPVVGVAAIVVLFGSRWWLGQMIKRRQKKFIEILPNAIDIMVRGVKSGLPLNESIKVIADEIPDPVRTEFRQLIDSVAVGVPIETALEKMYDRMPLPEVNFFRTVLAIQKKTGGNLSEALGNLSLILRSRKKLKGKIKALSSEARMSAMIIGSLPFLVGLGVYLITPDYIMTLFTDSRGQFMIAGGLFWMSLGVLMMRSMTRFEI